MHYCKLGFNFNTKLVAVHENGCEGECEDAMEKLSKTFQSFRTKNIRLAADSGS